MKKTTQKNDTQRSKRIRHLYEICVREIPDSILMDIRMFDGDGLEVTQRIKKELPKIIQRQGYKDWKLPK